MVFDLLLPADLPLWAAVAAIVASFFTAALTAAFGLGGGLALLAIMSAVFPAPAVIPIHGVAQLGSNTSRFILQRRHIVWPIALWFTGGGVLGAVGGGRIAVDLPTWGLQAGVGFFILYTLWGPKPLGRSPGPRTFFTTGAVAAFLTMFFGATGPIAATMVARVNLDRHHTTATHAACMVGQHTLKILVFGLLGFAYASWLPIIAAILATGFAGTFVGTRVLKKMPEAVFARGFKGLLSGLALYLLVSALISLRTG